MNQRQQTQRQITCPTCKGYCTIYEELPKPESTGIQSPEKAKDKHE